MTVPGSLAEWLERQGASKDVVDWARPYRADGERAWRECPRGDWLLAIAVRAKVPREALVAAAAACARAALDYVADGEARPGRAIEAAERWARDSSVSIDAATLAGAEAAVGDAADPAAAAAATSALAAARSSVVPEEAAMAPAAAAEAATLAADECGAMSAFRYTVSRAADAVRAAIAWSLIAPALSDAGRS